MPTVPRARRIGGWLVATALLAACTTSPRTRQAAQLPTAPRTDARTGPPGKGWTPIGVSVEGRPLLVAQAGAGPLRVYVIGGVHGDEVEGRSFLDALAAHAVAAASIRVLRDLNPDGTAARRRTNARGVDLNRNWPASNFKPGPEGGPAPLSEPETRLLQQDLHAFAPDVVVVLHAMSSGPLVNYDGPAQRLAAAFADAAQTAGPGWHVQPDMGYETSGSLGSYLGVDQQRPVLTIEFRRGQDEASAAAAARDGLAAVIRAAAGGDRPGR